MLLWNVSYYACAYTSSFSNRFQSTNDRRTMYEFFFFQVVNQYYEAEVVSEYVIRGNAAILKCTIPSFVADFVFVDAWISTDGQQYTMINDYGKITVWKVKMWGCLMIPFMFYPYSRYQLIFHLDRA